MIGYIQMTLEQKKKLLHGMIITMSLTSFHFLDPWGQGSVEGKVL